MDVVKEQNALATPFQPPHRQSNDLLATDAVMPVDQLADIFIDSLRRRGLDRIFPSGEVSYAGIGAFTNEDEQRRTVITGVVEDTPAHQAGLLIGDEILAADDLPFRPVAAFRGKVGVPVTRSVRRDPGGPPMTLSVTPVAIHPNAMFLRGLQASARVVAAANGVRVGYVHVWSYAGGVYQRALEDLIVDGPLRDADALVWDLRDGWGGAKPQYLDLFNPNAPTMQMTDRSGHIGIEDVKWRKPVVMLVKSRDAQRQGGACLWFQAIPPRRDYRYADRRRCPRGFRLPDGQWGLAAAGSCGRHRRWSASRRIRRQADDRGAFRSDLCGREGPAAGPSGAGTLREDQGTLKLEIPRACRKTQARQGYRKAPYLGSMISKRWSMAARVRRSADTVTFISSTRWISRSI
jgi:hypothetical protein